MVYLPMFLDPAAGTVALVGSGAAAFNKLMALRAAGASVQWFSGDVDVAEEMLIASPMAGRVRVDLSDPRDVDFSKFIAVVSAAGQRLDRFVSAQAIAKNIPVNVVDRPDLSTFIFPALIHRGDVVVAIGTGGASPVLARRLRERIEALLPARLGDLAALMKRFRRPFADARHATQSLRHFWESVIDGPVGTAALAGRWRDAEQGLMKAIQDSSHPYDRVGVVHIVGAGPGDPDLLTLKALHALQNADVIFYDDLVTPEILDRARRDAERVFVGKRKGRPSISQNEINRLLANAAREGRDVVRLKGGDPFIFGRGGEELEHLRDEGIRVVVVPGITAALGCAAEAGLPLTFRDEASRLSIVTAHRADEAAATDWSKLADRQTTVVVYMGLAAAANVRDGLIAAGRAPSTPVGVLARGTRPDARSIVGRLDELSALAAQVGEGPALLVIGEVVARSDVWRAQIDGVTRREIAA